MIQCEGVSVKVSVLVSVMGCCMLSVLTLRLTGVSRGGRRGTRISLPGLVGCTIRASPSNIPPSKSYLERERERERESMCVREREREREYVC